MFELDHVRNTAVIPNWGQLRREIICSIFGHQFYVPSGGGYPGLPQAHCHRCGVDDRMFINHVPGRPHYVVPNSYSQRQKEKFAKNRDEVCNFCYGTGNDPDTKARTCPICEGTG